MLKCDGVVLGILCGREILEDEVRHVRKLVMLEVPAYHLDVFFLSGGGGVSGIVLDCCCLSRTCPSLFRSVSLFVFPLFFSLECELEEELLAPFLFFSSFSKDCFFFFTFPSPARKHENIELVIEEEDHVFLSFVSFRFFLFPLAHIHELVEFVQECAYSTFLFRTVCIGAIV